MAQADHPVSFSGPLSDPTSTADPSSLSEHTREHIARVSTQFEGITRLGVAFSGGVDSSVLLAVALRAMGRDRVVALLGVSPSLPARERDAAHELARSLGAHLVEVHTQEEHTPRYIANGPDRCYHCKDELFTRIEQHVLDTYRLDALAYGENADDAVRLDRPGAAAATAHGVLRPLAVAGLSKADVRNLARALALASADKPAAPCLASRIPHHEPVTAKKLLQIERAELALHSLGFTEGRVRHHGPVARIEIPVDELAKAASTPVREQLADAIRAAGFEFVSLDLAGLQSGAFTMSALDRAEPVAEPSSSSTRPEPVEGTEQERR